MVKRKSNGFGIAGFVLSIIGLVLIFAPYIGIFLSILAIIFSRKSVSGLSTAGFIMGIIGTVLNAVMLLIVIIAISLSSAV